MPDYKWDWRFLELAQQIASWSKDPSTQTGCVIVDEGRRVLSVGYNGFPRGVVDSDDRYQDRAVKYQMVVHCDANAILAAAQTGTPLAGATMYLTGPPCCECTKMIIQAGIDEVVWPEHNKFEDDPDTMRRWRDSLATSLLMLREAGVTFRRVPDLG